MNKPATDKVLKDMRSSAFFGIFVFLVTVVSFLYTQFLAFRHPDLFMLIMPFSAFQGLMLALMGKRSRRQWRLYREMEKLLPVMLRDTKEVFQRLLSHRPLGADTLVLVPGTGPREGAWMPVQWAQGSQVLEAVPTAFIAPVFRELLEHVPQEERSDRLLVGTQQVAELLHLELPKKTDSSMVII